MVVVGVFVPVYGFKEKGQTSPYVRSLVEDFGSDKKKKGLPVGWECSFVVKSVPHSKDILYKMRS